MSILISKNSENLMRSVRHTIMYYQYMLSICLIMIVGFYLRCYGIMSEPINFDEGATWYFARLPFGDLWGEPARLEPNPPFFYAVAHGFVWLFGDSAGVLRLASVISGVLCIPVAAFIGRQLAGPAAGIATALLVASSTAHIVTSQDARAYSLLTLTALVAIAAEVSLLTAYRVPRQHGSRAVTGAWVGYVVASILALYVHNTAVLMVVALNLVAVLAWIGTLGLQRRFAIHWIMVKAERLAERGRKVRQTNPKQEGQKLEQERSSQRQEPSLGR